MEKPENKKKPFKAIVAVAENGVIGNGLHIPWRIPEDFAHFKRTTMGGVIVMGRKTWESLGCRPLPGRENVVLSSRPEDVKGILPCDKNFTPKPNETCLRAFSSLEEIEKFYAHDARNIWICGGAKLYALALPKTSEIILSRVKLSSEGDIFFPDISKNFTLNSIISEHEQFDVLRYVSR